MRSAFTLIELLVVVTVIVVLLALLAPAMDQAIYQAELALCGSKLHAITTGTIGYAMGNKRRYPDRPSLKGGGTARPFQLYYGSQGWTNPAIYGYDDRVILGQYLSINKTLQCPLARAVDLENSKKDTYVASNYGLYFGFSWAKARNHAHEKGMYRLGDRVTWDGESSNVLAADYEKVQPVDPGQLYGSHPDRDGIMVPYWFQDKDWPTGMVEAPSLTVTWSFWLGNKRGSIDANYARDDGAVVRFSRIKWDEGNPAEPGGEERFVWFPEYNNNTGGKCRLPRAN